MEEQVTRTFELWRRPLAASQARAVGLFDRDHVFYPIDVPPEELVDCFLENRPEFSSFRPTLLAYARSRRRELDHTLWTKKRLGTPASSVNGAPPKPPASV